MKKGKWFFVPFVIIIGLSFMSAQAANYTIAVNAATKTGSWNRFYERGVASDHMHTVLSTAYGGRGIKNALKIAHDSAGFQSVRGHGILDDDDAVYSENGGNAVYTWTSIDRIYDSIVAVGMRPLVEISFMPNALASAQSWTNSVWYNGFPGNWNAPKDWNKWKAFMSAFLTHLETRYGVAEVRNNWYFELWNEPNWMYGGGGGDGGYERLYDSTAVAFTATDPLVKLGGPAEGGGTGGSVVFDPQFATHCRTANKKLDFITYHEYAQNGAGICNGTVSSAYHKSIVDALKNVNFTGQILCTEMGPAYTQGSQCLDNEQSASFLAKSIHLLNSNDTIAYPPPRVFGWWALSDLYEETDNRAASTTFTGCYGLMGRGVIGTPQSWDIRKPSFNAFMLLHRLNTYKVSCTGGSTASPGVNAVATISAANDTVSVLIYSHVDNTNGTNTYTDNVTLNITGIPTSAGMTTATMKHWVVDVTHSNSYRTWAGMGSPANPTAPQWTTIANGAQLATYDAPGTVTLGGATGAATYTKNITQNYYSVGLVQLTNFRATAVSGPSQKFLDLTSGIKVKMAGKDLRIDLPSAGKYLVRLYSASGRKIVERKLTGTGILSLADVPAGVYMLDCTGSSQKLVTKVMVGR